MTDYIVTNAERWEALLERTTLSEKSLQKMKTDRLPRYRMASAEPVFSRPPKTDKES